MAAVETGLSALIHGHASLTSTSIDVTKAQIVGDIPYKKTPALKGEVKDGDGKVITRRYDDLTETLSLSLKVKATFTPLGIGGKVTIANATWTEINGDYTVENLEFTLKQGDYAEYKFDLLASEAVTLA